MCILWDSRKHPGYDWLCSRVSSRVGCTVSKNRSFGLQSSTFGVLCEIQWRIRFCNFFPFSKFFSYQELRAKKGGAPIKVKIFFQRMYVLWYLKEAYSKNRNRAPKILMIRVMVMEQLMKTFQNCPIAQNGAILEHFH